MDVFCTVVDAAHRKSSMTNLQDRTMIKSAHRVALSLLLCAVFVQPASASSDSVLDVARQIEERLNARVGYAIYDTGSNESWLHNANDRFPMASTFKVLLCAAILAKRDAGDTGLAPAVTLEQEDLVTYSPVTENWIGKEVSVEALCEATMRTSDNTAANKALEVLGGPESVTDFMRSIGDNTTRLDRWETELNTATPGDLRDTTTPSAMASSLRELIFGEALSQSSREQLTAWLLGNEVGGPLLRAGIPKDWCIGDRTGAGGHGSRGIVAVIWPPERDPLVAAIYITQTEASMEDRDEAIAAIGKVLADSVSKVR